MSTHYDASGGTELRGGALFECCVSKLQQTNAADSAFKCEEQKLENKKEDCKS